MNWRQLKAIIRMAGDDERRPILGGIHQSEDGVIVVTDTHRLYISEGRKCALTRTNDREKSGVTYSRESVILELEAAKKEKRDVELQNLKEDDSLGLYPNWQRVVPSPEHTKDGFTTIAFNAQYIKDIADLAKAHKAEKIVIDINKHDRPALFSFVDNNKKGHSVVLMPMGLE